MSDLTPEDRERLAAKYGIYSGPGYGVQDVTPEQAAARAWAEQVERTIREVRQACEDYNKAKGLEWLNWELPTKLRERAYQARARVQEAQARDARSPEGSETLVHYYDDRNKDDEAKGWPAYEYWNPDHQTVPLGTVVAKPEKAYVLRGGTAGGVLPRERHAPELDMPDYGPGYDFDTFMKDAERDCTFVPCDMRLPDGCCENPFDGNKQLVPVALGQHIYVLSICKACLTALFESFRREHPNWRKRRPRGA